ncbi:tetraspanin-16 [Aplysia californica]|uniref:Tetraspanin-16 n=1 Tax=Aplysia californica TaxID=6500 RepID=A0ABM0ZXM3_APLCA|nr:tetraspanin-16 [Aplysia californica]
MIKLLIIEIVLLVLILAFRSEIDSRVKGALQPTLDTYKGYNSTEPVTVGWNFVFSKFECCGIDSYSDLDTASSWPTSITYAGSAATLTAPIFCCKLNGTYPSMTLPASATCAESPTSSISNYESGCYKAVEEYILAYRITMLVVVSLIVVCEVLNIITAFMERSNIVADDNREKRRKQGQWKKMNKAGKNNEAWA